jgi:hypothetical protein
VRKSGKANADADQIKSKPAFSQEAKDAEMASLATELAEKQLREGTASAQVITHFLKIGARREKLEMEILEKQKELIEAKIHAYKSAEDMKELYARALNAMRLYSGNEDTDSTIIFGTDEHSDI